MKDLVSCLLSVLILVLAIVGSVYLLASLTGDMLHRVVAFVTEGFLIFFIGTRIVLFLVRRFEESLGGFGGVVHTVHTVQRNRRPDIIWNTQSY